MNFEYAYGATPLDPNEAQGLIPDYIQTQAELNVWEQRNILQARNQSYSLDEIAMRCHHLLVCIHPFVNGNGRHARLYTDAILFAQGASKFTWGKHLTAGTDIRHCYIQALRAADNGDYTALLEFVR